MGMSGMSGSGPGERRAMSDINVTPMVDIMLVLLIIFMVTAPLMSQGVDVELPNAEAKPLVTDKEPLVVSVTPAGKTYLEDKEVSLAEISTKVNAMKQANPDLTVYVKGDNQAAYGVVMGVMAELQRGGINRVGLVTEPK